MKTGFGLKMLLLRLFHVLDALYEEQAVIADVLCGDGELRGCGCLADLIDDCLWPTQAEIRGM